MYSPIYTCISNYRVNGPSSLTPKNRKILKKIKLNAKNILLLHLPGDEMIKKMHKIFNRITAVMG